MLSRFQAAGGIGRISNATATSPLLTNSREKQMKFKIFYSWQSDLPSACNRGFIQIALEAAAKTLRADDSIEVEPVVERDTAGIAGSPDIGRTILQKISEAHAFVADVSIINAGQPRLTPNPNVLFELGYAWNALTENRIIMVTNTAFGALEHLPFDLRMKRMFQYNSPADAVERAAERKKVEKTFVEAISLIIRDDHLNPKTSRIYIDEERVELSSNATEMLLRASEPEQEGQIYDLYGEPGCAGPEATATKEALEELSAVGFLRYVSGIVYALTSKGYAAASKLKGK